MFDDWKTHANGCAPESVKTESGGAIDLTPLWDAAHPHLRPFADHLPLPPDAQHACPLCGSKKAFKVVAQICVDQKDEGVQAAPLYCPECDRFSLDPESMSRLTELGVTPPNSRITAINARLWSSTPTFLNIEPTTRCNFRCWYCVGRHMPQKDIRVEDFARMLDHFPEVRAIALVGEGEPLMHKGFFTMADQARSRGIRVLTITNGSALSQSNVRKICESEITYISVSIDSTDPATFAESRLGGNLEKVLTGIRSLAEYRDANGYRYPRIGVKGTLFSHTQDQLQAIVELARDHGADIYEGFQPLNPMRTYLPIYPADKLAELQPANIRQVMATIQSFRQATVAGLKSVENFALEEGILIDKNGRANGLRPNCDEEWIYSLLSGDVTPCCQIKKVIDPNWNLFRRPLKDILHDPAYENTRFNLWNGIFPNYCSGCWKTHQEGYLSHSCMTSA